MKKILFLTNVPSPYRVDFFNELGKLIDLHVIYERKKPSDRDKSWCAKKAINFKETYLNGINVGNDSAFSFSILKYLRDKSYDIILVGGYSTPMGMLAIEYLKIANKPFILNGDGGIIKEDSNFKYKFKKHFIGSASAWLSTGKNTTDYFMNYGGKENKTFEYPFTSIKEQDIVQSVVGENEKKQLRKKLLLVEENIILSVGQFIHRKGFDVLIESMKAMPKNYGVYIIGAKPTEEYLKLKEDYNLTNLHFVGFKTKQYLSEYYKAADLFVLPTREDIWGLVINEAMSYGLPVITTEACVSGIELIKNNENGYIIPVDDTKELANKIITIMDNKELKLAMAIKSIETIKEYTIENMALRHIEIFNIILGGKYGK